MLSSLFEASRVPLESADFCGGCVVCKPCFWAGCCNCHTNVTMLRDQQCGVICSLVRLAALHEHLRMYTQWGTLHAELQCQISLTLRLSHSQILLALRLSHFTCVQHWQRTLAADPAQATNAGNKFCNICVLLFSADSAFYQVRLPPTNCKANLLGSAFPSCAGWRTFRSMVLTCMCDEVQLKRTLYVQHFDSKRRDVTLCNYKESSAVHRRLSYIAHS